MKSIKMTSCVSFIAEAKQSEKAYSVQRRTKMFIQRDFIRFSLKAKKKKMRECYFIVDVN